MARSGSRSSGLALVLLALGACLALNAISFVAPGSNEGRASRTAMQAELMKKDVKTDLAVMRSSVAGKLKKGTGPFEYSTGARNEVSLITPEVSTESIQAYLSIVPVFITLLLVFTIGGLIEIQRFFPDSMYW